MRHSPSSTLRMTVFGSLFAALVIVGGQLSVPIPVSPVPIVLADFFVLLTGLILGASWGLTSIGLLVFLGALGLPVFAQGKAGLAVLIGPTGGYVVGYLACVVLVGLIACKGKPSTIRDVVALIVGTVAIYAFGVPWLMTVTHLSWDTALAAGLTPFIVGAIIKIAVAAGVARALRPWFTEAVGGAPALEEE
jgi:biotin transport system substrate-specific component